MHANNYAGFIIQPSSTTYIVYIYYNPSVKWKKNHKHIQTTPPTPRNGFIQNLCVKICVGNYNVSSIVYQAMQKMQTMSVCVVGISYLSIGT